MTRKHDERKYDIEGGSGIVGGVSTSVYCRTIFISLHSVSWSRESSAGMSDD